MQAYTSRVRLALLACMASAAYSNSQAMRHALARYQAARACLSAALESAGTAGDKALAAQICPVEADDWSLSIEEIEKKISWMMDALCTLSFETPNNGRDQRAH